MVKNNMTMTGVNSLLRREPKEEENKYQMRQNSIIKENHKNWRNYGFYKPEINLEKYTSLEREMLAQSEMEE